MAVVPKFVFLLSMAMSEQRYSKPGFRHFAMRAASLVGCSVYAKAGLRMKGSGDVRKVRGSPGHVRKGIILHLLSQVSACFSCSSQS